MAENDKLRKLLEATIQKEVKRQLQIMLPGMVKEAMMNVMSGLITEGIQNAQRQPQAVTGNSDKRRRLTESLEQMLTEDDERAGIQKKRMQYATIHGAIDRVGVNGGVPGTAPSMAQMLEFDDPVPMAPGNIIVPGGKMSGELGQGVPVAVDPDEVPDFLIAAMNKDYSGLMKSTILKNA